MGLSDHIVPRERDSRYNIDMKQNTQAKNMQTPVWSGTIKQRFVTFGSVLRGYRLGYGWSGKHGCFVRIDAHGPPWQVTLAPNGGIPSKMQGSKEHICWWDSEESTDILDEISGFKLVRGIHRVIQFRVDDEGNVL